MSTDKTMHRKKQDRRGGERRKKNIPVKVERRQALERRTLLDRRHSST